MISERGIEIEPAKPQVIIDMSAPFTLKEAFRLGSNPLEGSSQTCPWDVNLLASILGNGKNSYGHWMSIIISKNQEISFESPNSQTTNVGPTTFTIHLSKWVGLWRFPYPIQGRIHGGIDKLLHQQDLCIA